ncbi:LamG domain-containing protein [Dielma fastidiosa]|uniref:LamG domain-containing protein n=1 Tax=Dielma fastidiosa TaxID=1034346 RepID=A0AB35UNQ0_9FIRM|nr:LamG domain-containing protein [Dielma fastidiosa]MDY5168616.1 LamG domain-containing protein [Dielma fastidiosa]
MYDKTVWIDHIADPNTGEVLQQGTRFDQAKMNNIENGIYDAHESLQELEDAKVKEFAITLAADQWIDNSYTILNSLLTANTSGRLIMGVNSDQAFTDLKNARISKSAVLSNGSLVISASGIVPPNNINLILQIKSVASNEFIIDLPSDGGDADTLGKKEPAYFASKADYSALLQRIEAAEKELEKKISKNMSMQFCLPLVAWNENNQQTLLCDKYKTNSNLVPMYLMPMSNVNACANAGVSIIANTETTITFECSNIPTTDLVIAVSYQGESDTWYEVLEELGEKVITWTIYEFSPSIDDCLLLINSEGGIVDDKTKNKNPVYNAGGSTANAETYSYEERGYFKGEYVLAPNNTNYDSAYIVKNIKKLDITKPWQISFSFGFNVSDISSTYSVPEFPVVFSEELGIGIKSYDRVSLKFYYLNKDTGALSYEVLARSSDRDKYHCRIIYKQVNGVWNYVYELTDKAGTLITKSYPTKELIDVDYEIKISGYGRREGSSSSWSKRSVVDDVLVLGHVEDTHTIPLLNSNEDQYLYGSWKDVEYSAIVTVNDNTILRHNIDGTIDQYVTQTLIPQPYSDNVSSYEFLLHGEELKNSSINKNGVRFSSVVVSSDIYKVGSGSYKVNGYIDIDSSIHWGRKINFTIDFWVYPTKLSGTLLSMTSGYTPNIDYTGIRLDIDSSGYLTVNEFKNGITSKSKTPIELNKWYHIALVKQDNSLKLELFIDLISQCYINLHLDSDLSDSYDTWNRNTIGAFMEYEDTYSDYFNGYFDEIRISDKAETEFTPYIKEKGWERI